jgi:L-ascorbate metabolism protein UlaG (beta-lactamase superfamily)
MKLTMLSHASVLVEEGPLAICADPWFMGDAFNESWSLLCEPAMTPASLQGVTHIWISHEHLVGDSQCYQMLATPFLFANRPG